MTYTAYETAFFGEPDDIDIDLAERKTPRALFTSTLPYQHPTDRWEYEAPKFGFGDRVVLRQAVMQMVNVEDCWLLDVYSVIGLCLMETRIDEEGGLQYPPLWQYQLAKVGDHHNLYWAIENEVILDNLTEIRNAIPVRDSDVNFDFIPF